MKIGAYEIDREIGRGAWGVVYRARSPSGRPVALKVLAQDARTETGRIRFDRESAAARSVRHENVVALLDAGRENRTSFLVFELVEGGTLAARVARTGPLGWREVARLGAGIARGLAAIHAVDLVHRDLKPANVLLDADGRPKVADLGLVRRTGVTAGAQDLTRTGELVGTPAFLAPEQVDSARTVDSRADLYALGATLFFLLTGEPPFSGPVLTVVKAHMFQSPPRPRARVATVPPELDDLVFRLLAKAPDARGAGAAAVAGQLDALATGSASRVGRRAVKGGASLAIGAALALGAAFVGVARCGGAAAGAAAGAAPAAAVARDAAAARAVRAVLDTGHKVVTCIAFSEDGRLLATGGAEGVVALWDAPSRRLLRRVGTSRSPIASLALSSDGNLVLWGEASGDVRATRIDREAETEGVFIANHGSRKTRAEARVSFVTYGGVLYGTSGALDGYVKLHLYEPRPRVAMNEETPTRGLTAIAATGETIVWGDGEGVVGIVNLGIEDGHLRGVSMPFDQTRKGGAVRSIVVAPDGALAVSASADGTVRSWDTKAYREKERSPPWPAGTKVRALSLASRADLLLALDEGGFTLWHPGAGGPVERRSEPRAATAAAIAADGKTVAVATADAVVHLVGR